MYPPSTNQLYKQTRFGQKYLSAKHQEFRERMYTDVRTQLLGTKDFPLTGEVQLFVELVPKDKRKRDIDNGLKAILDALQYANVIQDDAQINKLVVARTRAVKSKDGLCFLTLETS